MRARWFPMWIAVTLCISALCTACEKEPVVMQQHMTVASSRVYVPEKDQMGRALLVKEGSSKKKWFSVNEIKGFEYEPGFEYTIVVQAIVKEAELPANSKNPEYTLQLVELLSKEEKKTAWPNDFKPVTEGSELKLITIASKQVYLDEESDDRKGFLIKEAGDETWHLWPGTIQGFTYQPGHEYTVWVEVNVVGGEETEGEETEGEGTEGEETEDPSVEYVFIHMKLDETKDSTGLPEEYRYVV